MNEGEALQIPWQMGTHTATNKKVALKGIRASQRLEVKTMSRLRCSLFSDMDTCYNCLHSFMHDEMKSEEASPNRNGQFTTMEDGAETQLCAGLQTFGREGKHIRFAES